MNGLILTERLRMTPWSEHHAEDFLRLSCDDGFHAYPITNYRQASVESAREWVRKASAQFQKTKLGKLAILDRASDSIIGMGGLTPWQWEGEDLVDLTYRFEKAAWGRGFGTEAALGLIQYGFNVVGLDKITATITPDNFASIKVADRIGMKFKKRILLLGVETNLYDVEAERFE